MSTMRCRHLLIKYSGSRNPTSRRTGKSTENVSAGAAQDELQQYIDKINAEGCTEAVFAKYAQERSDCGSFREGGDLGEFGPGQMQKQFEEGTANTGVGSMSGIVLSDSGYHIIFRTKDEEHEEEQEEGEGLRSRAGAAVFPGAEEEVEGRLSSLQPSSEEFSFSRRIVFCIAGGLVAALVFPVLVRVLRSSFSVSALLAIREDNNAQWMQNFFTGIGFIFSLFVAQTFGFLYGQQEQIYFALYAEVSEAKALLEQLTLVCRTRDSYGQMLLNLQKYVRGDLQRLDCSPTQLLAGRASGTSGRDPLESVLYATSVGVPSYVYETVRGLRQARGARLGATQKKLPDAHFAILNILGILELSVFPILAAGCAALEPPGMASRPGHIVFFHAILFGVMTSGVALTLSVLWDLFSPVGETYNLQTIVRDMASGLDEELEARIQTAGEREPQEQEISSTRAQSQSSPA